MKKIFTFLMAVMMTASVMAAETITVAEAIEKAKALGAGNTSTETYTVVGYVAKLYNSYKDGAQSFYMSDTKNDASERFDFEAFKAKISEAVVVGYQVSLTGKLTYYKSNKGNITYEIKDGTATILDKGDGGSNPPAGSVAITGIKYADAYYYDGYWAFDLYKDYSDEDGLSYPEFYAEVPAFGASKINGTYTMDEETAYMGLWKSEKDSVEFVSGSLTVKATGGEDEDEYPIYNFQATLKGDDGKTYTMNVNAGVYAMDYESEDEITLKEDGGSVTPTPSPVGTVVTVAQAEEITSALAAGTTSSETYTIIGYVGTTYSSGDFYLLDVAGTKSNFEVYKPTVDYAVSKGDKVQVVGYLKNYSTKAGKTILEMVNATVTHLSSAALMEVGSEQNRTKILKNNQVLILHNDRLYTITGEQVK